MVFVYQNNRLMWRQSFLPDLCQKIEAHLFEKYNYRGPYFLYNRDVLDERLSLLSDALPESMFFYSVKSLSNLHILKRIRERKNFGLDVVSGMEILRGLQAGFSADKIVFAGVGKTADEIRLGLEKNIKSFHAESVSELKKIAEIAASLGKIAPVSLRINPDIEVDTHHYIATGKKENKFGIAMREIPQVIELVKSSPSLRLVGLQSHLGSQLKVIDPYLKALRVISQEAVEAEKALGYQLQYLSLGGGFGIDYTLSAGNTLPVEFPVHDLARALAAEKNPRWPVYFEPGRFVSAYSGILVTHVLYLKDKSDYQIAIVDSGMSELIRPALYDAVHPVLPLVLHEDEKKMYDVVGPICESGDFFRKGVKLNLVEENDTLAILHAGAYGSVMSSSYNSRLLVPEVLFYSQCSAGFEVIRRPQTPDELLQLETSVQP